MSETLTDAAAAFARRSASRSATLLRATAGFARSGRAAPASEAAPAAATRGPPTPAPSVISAKAEINGSIRTSEELHVHGAVEGDISAAKIVVCAGGVVKGGLTAETVIIHGAVEGRIDGQHVALCAHARVKGDITHRTLGIDTTASFEGSVKRLPKADAEPAGPK